MEHTGTNRIQCCREKSHLYLSIKQLQDDPRLETPDKSMPVQSQVSDPSIAAG